MAQKRIDTSFIPDNGTGIKESPLGKEVDMYSLETIMKKYGVNSGILKMDCEGCEYHLLEEKNEIISKFSQIQIEYHYGYEKLVNKLNECGFNTEFTEPIKSYNESAGKTMMIGYIFAKSL